MIGTVHGHRRVICEAPRDRHGRRRYVVECACGERQTVHAFELPNRRRCQRCANRVRYGLPVLAREHDV